MLLNVVDQCLSLALATAARRRGATGASPLARRHAPLAAYPRLQAVMAKAEADGLIRRIGQGR